MKQFPPQRLKGSRREHSHATPGCGRIPRAVIREPGGRSQDDGGLCIDMPSPRGGPLGAFRRLERSGFPSRVPFLTTENTLTVQWKCHPLGTWETVTMSRQEAARRAAQGGPGRGRSRMSKAPRHRT